MADTNYGVNHPLAVKHWSKDLLVEALKKTQAMQFMGSGSGAICQIKSELNKAAGDRIRVGLRVQLKGAGIQGDATLEGNEEALTTYYDDVTINQLRHAVRSEGKMSEQRVPFSVREEARDGLADWWADRFDTAFFNQLAGNTAVTDTRYTGNIATVAPDSDHVIYHNQSTEASLGSTDTFTLSIIDKCVERATTFGKGSADFPDSMPMRPVTVGADGYYVMFLHPYQVTDLRTNTNTGQWLDIQKAAMTGGKVSNNPIFSGALGMYNNTILHQSDRIPSVVANTRRAVFCGAQAAAIAFGQESGKNKMSWKEELFDYGNALGVAVGSIFGLKRTIFNSKSFGSIVVSTYAVKHS